MILALWSAGFLLLGMSPGYIWGYRNARQRFERKRGKDGRLLPKGGRQ